MPIFKVEMYESNPTVLSCYVEAENFDDAFNALVHAGKYGEQHRLSATRKPLYNEADPPNCRDAELTLLEEVPEIVVDYDTLNRVTWGPYVRDERIMLPKIVPVNKEAQP